ncbi:MAG: threonine synthase, partial [Rhodospirillaceae bacterium]
MRYVSTRGEAPELFFDDVLLAGLAQDGGLYVPVDWPAFTAEEIREMRGLDYAATAARVMAPFVGAALTDEELEEVTRKAYAGFTHPAVAPLVQVGPDDWVLELFHGPTLAFKDYALQVVGQLFDLILTRRGERITVVGATSGDTGSAGIEACRDREAVDIVMLFPKGRVSPVQRRQMTTVTSANVHCLEIDGTFDDCQDLVKAMFNDAAFRSDMNLSAVNSINWARVAAQVVYYFYAALRLGAPDRPMSFSVPTGNFGNVLAGWVAKQMGLPVERLVVASNSNDILTRFLESGSMEKTGVVKTHSPSMDIQISSNFERLLFELFGRDAAEVRARMTSFAQGGRYEIPGDLLQEMLGLFRGFRVSDDDTVAEIQALKQRCGVVVDPHTAVAIAAAREAGHRSPEGPLITLATAHPAKFPAV